MIKSILIIVLFSWIEVNNESNHGPGSFRDAILKTQNNPFDNDITFSKNVKIIKLNSRINYESALPLYIHGPIEIRSTEKVSEILKFKNISNLVLNDCRFINSGASVLITEENNRNTRVRLNNVLIRDSRGIGFKINDISKHHLNFFARNLTVVRSTSMGCYINKGYGDLNANLNYCNIVNNGQINNSDGMQLSQFGTGNLNANIYNCDFIDNNEDGLECEEFGDGDNNTTVFMSTFFDNGEENLEVNESAGGDCIVDLSYVVVEGFDEHDEDRNDGIELLENHDGDLYINMYKCDCVGSEFDGLRILPGGKGNALINIDQCLFIDNIDEGIEIEPRLNQNFEGLIGLYIYNSISKYNLGNGIKAVAPNGGVMEIYGNESDYRPNFGGNLDTDNTWWWMNDFALDLD